MKKLTIFSILMLSFLLVIGTFYNKPQTQSFKNLEDLQENYINTPKREALIENSSKIKDETIDTNLHTQIPPEELKEEIIKEEEKIVENTSTVLHWAENFEDAIKLAKQEKKNIILKFSGSDWCSWCKKLDKKVLKTQKFNELAGRSFVGLIIDFPKKIKQSKELKITNQKLMKKFKVKGFPTIIIVNIEGKVLKNTGYANMSPIKYLQHLEK